METSINIVSTAGGKKKQKSMTNINPSATNEELGEIGRMITALSTNSYVNTVRIDKMDVNEPTPTPTPSKTEPTLTVSDGTISYNGDGQIFGFVSNVYYLMIDRDAEGFAVIDDEGNEPESYTVTIYASEGTNYAAKLASYTKGA